MTHALRAEGFDASEDGTGRGTPLIPCAATLNANGKAAGSATQQDAESGMLIIHDARGMNKGQNGIGISEGEVAYTLDRNACQAVAFNCKQSAGDAGDVSPPLMALNHRDSHANAGGQVAIAFQERGREGGRNLEIGGEVAYSVLSTTGGGRSQELNICNAMRVRRLTPRECERLQGFSDDYTAVTYRGKPAADGPRYRALGNSMAVPVMRWIGERIQAVESIQ